MLQRILKLGSLFRPRTKRKCFFGRGFPELYPSTVLQSIDILISNWWVQIQHIRYGFSRCWWTWSCRSCTCWDRHRSPSHLWNIWWWLTLSRCIRSRWWCSGSSLRGSCTRPVARCWACLILIAVLCDRRLAPRILGESDAGSRCFSCPFISSITAPFARTICRNASALTSTAPFASFTIFTAKNPDLAWISKFIGKFWRWRDDPCRLHWNRLIKVNFWHCLRPVSCARMAIYWFFWCSRRWGSWSFGYLWEWPFWLWEYWNFQGRPTPSLLWCGWFTRNLTSRRRRDGPIWWTVGKEGSFWLLVHAGKPPKFWVTVSLRCIWLGVGCVARRHRRASWGIAWNSSSDFYRGRSLLNFSSNCTISTVLTMFCTAVQLWVQFLIKFAFFVDLL